MQTLFSESSTVISFTDVIFSLILAIVLGLFVRWIYQQVHLSASYDRSYEFSLILLGPIVAIVMIYIGSNLALSLGMVGSLSIIRFRTAIKSTSDMIFLFWMIAIGLGCGTYNWTAVIFSTIFLGGIILIFGKRMKKSGDIRMTEIVLVINGSKSIKCEELHDIIGSFSKDFDIRSLESRKESWEYVYQIPSIDTTKGNLENLIDRIKLHPSVESISILSPQLSLAE